MCKTSNSRAAQGAQIYISAQSGTNNITNPSNFPNKAVYGKGSDLGNKVGQERKAKRKMITQVMTRLLAEIALEKGDTKRAQGYWNAYHCQSKLTKSGGRSYGNYCKNRWCLICSANRRSMFISRYYPTLSKWPDPHFVTLTVKAVRAEQLNKWLKKGLKRGFRRILDKYKKRAARGKCTKLMGVKSLECNFNPVKHTYNPHYHIIVPDRKTALILKKEWLALWGKKHTSPKAQHSRPVKDLEKDLIEIIKYGSKIFTEPDMKRKAKDKIHPKIYAAALDNIFVAMKGLRLFDRFGFNLDKVESTQKASSQLLVDYEELVYDPSITDWVNVDSGTLQTGFVPKAELSYLLNHNIDVEKK